MNNTKFKHLQVVDYIHHLMILVIIMIKIIINNK